jgi:hypothetical protein
VTTLAILKIKCPECNEICQCTIPASFGFRGIDKQGCREYWGLNPMPYHIIVCPYCEYVDWYFNYEKLEGEPEDSLIEAEPSCDSYDKYAETLIVKGAESAIIASIFHQSGCCKRINGEDSVLQFQRALEYFKKAKEEGINEIGNLGIDEWIRMMSNNVK